MMALLTYFRSIITASLLLLVSSLAIAQTEELEEQLKDQSGFERLETLIRLADLYEPYDAKKGRKYARQAYQIVENLRKSGYEIAPEDQQLLVDGLIVFGKSQYKRENYLDVKTIMEDAIVIAEEIEYKNGKETAADYLSRVNHLIESGRVKENFFSRTLSDIDIGSTLKNSTNNLNTGLAIKTGKLLESKGDTLGAIEHYEKAARLLRDRGELDKAAELELKIKTLKRIQELNQVAPLVDEPEPLAQDTMITEILAQKFESDRTQLSQLQTRALALESSQDYEQALSYYKEYIALQQKWERDSVTKALDQAQAQAELAQLKQESLIADLNISAIQREKEIQVRIKNTLVLVASIVAISGLVVLFLYFSKKKKHSQLTLAYTQLDRTKNELQDAETRISRLLQQQVSPEIASTLMDEKAERKKQYVAIMFLDIRGFTPIAEKMEPQELIEYQNRVFGFMIEIVSKNHGNINQFMGDGFMATFGAPVSHGNNERNAFLAGKQILESIDELNRTEADLPQTKVGIGIHAGDVVTGNVGTEERKQFSVTGNTVIIAARIEQLNKQFQSSMIITEEIKERLEEMDLRSEEFSTEKTKVKGRSEAITIHILGHLTTDSPHSD